MPVPLTLSTVPCSRLLSWNAFLLPRRMAARGLVQLLEFGADMETFRVAPDYYVVKFTVPDKFIGYYANELNLDKEFGLKMLALKRAETLKNCLGVSYVEHNVLNELPENDQIQAGDQLVCSRTV